MSLVRGENFVGFGFDGGIWKPYVCARSGNINITTETIETSVTGTGNWKTFEATIHSFILGLEGLVSLNVSGSLGLAELQAIQFAKTKMYWRFTHTSEDGDVYIKEFYAFITNTTETGAFDGIATFTVELLGTGSINQIYTPPSPTTGTVYRYPAMGDTAPTTSGEQSITVAGLGNKNILGVWKDGVGNNDIILSGTPVGKEVLYETSGSDGVFTWAVPFDGENWFCQYQDL